LRRRLHRIFESALSWAGSMLAGVRRASATFYHKIELPRRFEKPADLEEPSKHFLLSIICLYFGQRMAFFTLMHCGTSKTSSARLPI
jgi:hypothetical protein